MKAILTAGGMLAAYLIGAGPALAQEGLLLDRDKPAPTPAPAPAAAPPQTAPTLAQAAAPNARLTRVSVEGAKTLPAVTAAWQPFVGKALDAPTLRAIADAVAKAYGRTDALYTVNLPDQNFAGGAVRLQVIEGHFENVVIRGKVKGRDMGLIRGYAARMAAETPLTRRTLERYISLIRDIPGLKPDIQLLHGATAGGVILVVNVTEQRFSWGVSGDNRGSPLVDQQELQVTGVMNSTFRQGDQTRLTVASSADLTSARAVSLAHSEPLNQNGLRLDLSTAWLQTRASRLALKGTATTAAAQLSYPLIRAYQDNLYLTFGLDGLDNDNAILGQTASSEHTRNARAGFSFSRAAPTSSFSLSVVGSLGLDGLGARVNPLLADVNYDKVTFRAAYARKLGQSFTLRLRAIAQDAGGSLLPDSEKLALGGGDFGRGFVTAVMLGDSGTAGSAELAWAPKGLPPRVAGTEFYTFADTGEVSLNARPGVFTARADSLSSAGAGVRLALKPGYVVGLEAARAVDSPTGVDHAWRYDVELSSHF